MAAAKVRGRIGIVDGDAPERSKIADSLSNQFEILGGEDHKAAYNLLLEGSLDVLLLSLTLPSGGLRECLALLRDLQKGPIDTVVIVLSDDEKKATALKVMDAGAYDYFLKPVDPDILAVILNRAVEKLQIERENRILREEFERKDAVGDLLGSTEAMRTLFDSIRRVAQSTATVVIRGESGAGKELVARAIHDLGPRRDRPFVSVNCAALPETLMESELFGYERGAFTGAVAAKEGQIELAQRGTLFLDEIGTLSLSLQSKLLRVLDGHYVTRLGGKKPIKVDFRLLTATNEDLEKAVKEARFRDDLYYRIHVVPLFVPPLRERVDDIPLLIDYFLKVYCAANHIPPKPIDDEALEILKRYSWPGNVRELENVVQRMVLLTDGEVIRAVNLPRAILEGAKTRPPLAEFLPRNGASLDEEVVAFERRCLETAIAESGGRKHKAAEQLGIGKDRMKYLCRKHGL